jgi:hypothetical protein
MGDVLVDPVPPSDSPVRRHAADLLVGWSMADALVERVLPTVTRIAEHFPESTVFYPLLSTNPKGEAAVGSLTL